VEYHTDQSETEQQDGCRYPGLDQEAEIQPGYFRAGRAIKALIRADIAGSQTEGKQG